MIHKTDASPDEQTPKLTTPWRKRADWREREYNIIRSDSTTVWSQASLHKYQDGIMLLSSNYSSTSQPLDPRTTEASPDHLTSQRSPNRFTRKEKSCGGIVAITSKGFWHVVLPAPLAKKSRKVAGSIPAHGVVPSTSVAPNMQRQCFSFALSLQDSFALRYGSLLDI